MLFFFKPKWHRLADPKVWVHAAATNFFSLGIGGGGNITLASFNKYQVEYCHKTYTLFIN
ncbi:hypothetical protein KUTeg_011888 [Tegillarca granosa]|uniref:Uncharacterized protein n=1 Tax=Tegillarca granosa TaxID=220873 RepID=A0ABQ9EXZ5_TEGGR|nr:hypothetical protein KUTeg_011888 [Tegillarca granosa]